MRKLSFLSKRTHPEIKVKPEEIFLKQMQEYIQNRIIWLMRDLNRNEGFDDGKVEALKESIEKRFLKVVETSMSPKEEPTEKEEMTLRKHIQKMGKTLNAQGRFSPIKNPSDRALLINIVDIILKDLGIKKVRWDNAKKQRELA